MHFSLFSLLLVMRGKYLPQKLHVVSRRSIHFNVFNWAAGCHGHLSGCLKYCSKNILVWLASHGPLMK